MIPKIFQQLTYWPTYLFLRLVFGYKVEGRENLKGLEHRAVIFASNHASYFDGPVSAAAMPRNSLVPKDFFPVRFLVLEPYFRYFKSPFPILISLFTASYVRINGSIPIRKGLGDLNKALSNAVSCANDCGRIWIYPEGRITEDGKLQPGKRGVAFLQKETGAPIVPVGISGTFGMVSLKTFFGKTKIKVKIGKPIYSFKNPDALEENVEKVMSEIAKLI